MTIHKEGKQTLLTVSFLLIVVYVILVYLKVDDVVLNVYAALGIILFLIFLQFFRKPNISPHKKEGDIVAPVDGKVVIIEQVKEDEFLNEERTQISIFMSPVNVHINRNPVSGIIKYFKYHKGKYLMAFNPKSSIENERSTIVYETASGMQLLIRQVAGFLARRLVWYIDKGDNVEQSEEFGFIKFGSRIDLFIPLDAKIKVNIGDKTKGGRTVIATEK